MRVLREADSVGSLQMRRLAWREYIFYVVKIAIIMSYEQVASRLSITM